MTALPLLIAARRALQRLVLRVRIRGWEVRRARLELLAASLCTRPDPGPPLQVAYWMAEAAAAGCMAAALRMELAALERLP